jgi:hypothetical protein
MISWPMAMAAALPGLLQAALAVVAEPGLVAAEGDAVILTDNDSNGSKI